jgi:multidrug transporter EmrE-like cation transporter
LDAIVSLRSMLTFVGISAVFVSAVLIAVADALIKKVSISNTFLSATLHPWMIAVYILYFLQILLVIYIFMRGGDLAIYGNIFIIFYSILIVLLGVIVFKEHLSALQIVGIVLGLTGALLLNGLFGK